MIETQEQIVIQAAGRTLVGKKRTSGGEYICCVKYGAGNAIKGVFGIAGGADEEARGAEIALDTIRNHAEKAGRNGGSRGNGLIKKLLLDANEALLKENSNGKPPVSAALVCGFIEGGVAHIGHAGGGAAYIIENGKITRLTRNTKNQESSDVEMDRDITGSVPSGVTDGDFKPETITRKLDPGSTLIFCSDTLLSRIDNFKIRELLKKSDTIEEGTSKILEEAHTRDDADDVSLVIVDIKNRDDVVEPPEEIPGEVLNTLLKKNAVVASLALLIGLVFYFLPTAQDGRSIPVKQETEGAAPVHAVHDYRNETPSEYKPGLELEPNIFPRPSKRFLEGSIVRLDKPKTGSPANYGASSKRRTRTRTGKTRKAVAAYVGNGGAMTIFCRPACDTVVLDGVTISTFSRSQIVLREIPSGRHKVSAKFQGKSDIHSFTSRPGIAQFTIFNFGGPAYAEQSGMEIYPGDESGQTPTENNSASRERPKFDVVATNPRIHPETEKESNWKPVSTASSAVQKAFFVVDSDVRNASFMLLKNGSMALTGVSGVKYEVPPGVYKLRVFTPGYRDAIREVSLTGEFQRIGVKMSEE